MKVRTLIQSIGAGLAALAIVSPGAAQTGAPVADPPQMPPEVQWHKLDLGLLAAQNTDKHIMVNVYTDWCGYCKKLDRETYTAPAVRAVLDESYVSVKLKGDSGTRLKVRGQPVSEAGKTVLQIVPTDEPLISEKDLTRNQLRVRGFPTILFLTADGRMITSLSGFRDAESFTHILNFIKDDLYEVMTFQDYVKSLDNEAAADKGKS